MLQLSSMVVDRPVLSLRIGREVANTVGPIINPDNLKIEGFYCQEHSTHKRLILLSQDIRDVLPQGIVVNDAEVLTSPEELVRLDRLLKINFNLIGKAVETASKAKVGKVNDYALEVQTMYIQKIYVAQSLLKSLSGGNLGIDRSQIVEITDKKIVVNDLEAKVPANAQAVA
jgi:uncharacterized protein YrrD